MDLSFSAEQRELGAVVRAFLTRHCPDTEVRRLLDDPIGFDRGTWQRMATELGLQGMAVPEQYGGSGYGPVELGVVFEELGRALAAGPALASVALATTALLASGDSAACERYLPRLVTGEVVATLALTEESGSWVVEDVQTRAEESADGWALTGTKNFVLDGCAADLLLVVARSREGLGLYAVEAADAGATLERTELRTFDPTRRQARVTLRATHARRIGEGTGGCEQALRTGAVLLAAEQVGVASWALDTAVAYAKLREQFGRPIGSFQAVKHKAADMLLRLEGARSASAFALWAAAERPDQLAWAAAIAKAYCSEAASFCVNQCLQVHGGIGFTWEHPTHLYLKRAKSGEHLLGSPAQHRTELARLAGF